MPAKSKSQQRLFAMVHAIKKGKINPKRVSPAARKLARSMPDKEIVRYATTHVSNLPQKIHEFLMSPDLKELDGCLPVTDTPPASSGQPHISNDPNLVTFDEDYSEKKNKISAIIKNKTPGEVDGTLVDVYTAALLNKVISSLSPDKQLRFLQLPVGTMVAAAYKLVTR